MLKAGRIRHLLQLPLGELPRTMNIAALKGGKRLGKLRIVGHALALGRGGQAGQLGQLDVVSPPSG